MAGVVLLCIRDSQALNQLSVGVLALASMPRKSVKRGHGVRGEAIFLQDVTIEPGNWLYADPDGVIVSDRDIR